MTLRAVPPNAGILGQGVAYPLALDGKGRLALSAGEQSVTDALTSIVQTFEGERVMQRDYGAGSFVHEPYDPARFELQLRRCIAEHEPRVSGVNSVSLSLTTNPGEVILTLDYTIGEDATPATLTYPFAVGPTPSAVSA